MSATPPPRVWWDGYSLLILCPDGEEMPPLCRGRTLRDIELSELPIVELVAEGQ